MISRFYVCLKNGAHHPCNCNLTKAIAHEKNCLFFSFGGIFPRHRIFFAPYPTDADPERQPSTIIHHLSSAIHYPIAQHPIIQPPIVHYPIIYHANIPLPNHQSPITHHHDITRRSSKKWVGKGCSVFSWLYIYHHLFMFGNISARIEGKNMNPISNSRYRLRSEEGG